MARGHPPAAVSAFAASLRRALASLPAPSPPAYLVDDASAQTPALALRELLGVDCGAPYIGVVEDFGATRRKYLLRVGGGAAPGDAEVGAFLRAAAAGALAPTLVGAPRPPRDACAWCPPLVEVVTDSLHELVLAPTAPPTLLLLHRARCDACKALAPRYRMLAQLCAARLPGVRVARMDVGENDVDVAALPERWTPLLRFFPRAPPGAPAPPSVLHDCRVAAPGGGGGGPPARVRLPTVPDLLRMACGGAEPPPGALAEAEALEAEAEELEAAYEHVMDYLQLWKVFSEVAGGAPSGAAAAERLKDLVLDVYAFLVERAAAGGAEGAFSRLDAIAEHVRAARVSEAVVAAAAKADAAAAEQGAAGAALGAPGSAGGAGQ